MPFFLFLLKKKNNIKIHHFLFIWFILYRYYFLQETFFFFRIFGIVTSPIRWTCFTPTHENLGLLYSRTVIILFVFVSSCQGSLLSTFQVQVTRQCLPSTPCSCWRSLIGTGIQGKSFAIFFSRCVPTFIYYGTVFSDVQQFEISNI